MVGTELVSGDVRLQAGVESKGVSGNGTRPGSGRGRLMNRCTTAKRCDEHGLVEKEL